MPAPMLPTSRAAYGADLVARLAAVGTALAACGLMLWAAGQPIFTDDLWWHLGLGEAFARHGPQLAEDPLLFDAAAPPSRAAWLFELTLHGVERTLGFQGLRALHALWVALLLAIVAGGLARESRSLSFASLGVIAFVTLAAYRLVQLRPHLASMLAGLALYELLLRRAGPPSWTRVALAAALAALWSNLHAAFPLALVLTGAAVAGLALAAGLGIDPGAGARARRLAVALAAIALATLLNPEGIGAYRAYLVAGSDTPDLAAVADEWRRFDWLRPPPPTLPPSLAGWAVAWALVAGTLGATLRSLRPRGEAPAPDAVLLALAWTGLALATLATRFLWLGVFALLLVARSLVAGRPRSSAQRALAAVAALALLLGFARHGDWPAITRGLPTDARGYAKPYPSEKYYGHAIWFLEDAGLRGNLYTEYFQGGYAGYWLQPKIRTLVNGSLNVRPEVVAALGPILERRGARDGESFPALLDRLDLDLFLGIRVPETGNPHRPWAATTAHLEQTPGWIPVFRNLASAVYLRANDRNRENLARAAGYYATHGVPFDRERGFSPAAAIESAPEWSVEHGLAPPRFAALEHASRRHPGARQRLASIRAALGDYAGAIALDREQLAQAPDDVRARRRLVWSLLRSGRLDEAREAAAPLAERPAADGLSRHIADVARRAAGLAPDERERLIARLPFLPRAEVELLLGGIAAPAARAARQER